MDEYGRWPDEEMFPILRREEGWTEALKVGDLVIFEGDGWPPLFRLVQIVSLRQVSLSVLAPTETGNSRTWSFWRGPSGRKRISYAREGLAIGGAAKLHPATTENINAIDVAMRKLLERHYLSACVNGVRRAWEAETLTFAQARQIAEILGLELSSSPTEDYYVKWRERSAQGFLT